MPKQTIQLDLQRFHVSRLIEFPSGLEGEIFLEVEMHLHTVEQRVLIGVTQLDWLGRNSRGATGVVVSLDVDDGTLTDVVNGQGVLGQFENCPLATSEAIFAGVTIEKHGNVYLPKISVGEESILYPAVYLPPTSAMSFIVGSSERGRSVSFENPHFQAIRHPSEAA